MAAAAQLTFGGCGGMYSYEMGVAAVVQKNFDLDDVAFGGASGGCIPAAILARDRDVEELHSSWNLPFLAEVTRNRFGALDTWNGTLRWLTLPQIPERGYETASSRLYISMTRFPSWRNEVVSTWTSNEDLVDGIVASSFVPLFDAGKITARFRGERYVDGALTNSWPLPHGDAVPSLVIKRDMWRANRLSWLWCWADPDWGDRLYKWGVEDAEAHMEELAAVLKPRSV
jgi:predicted acylesterase/phospholipase RssA